MGEAGAVSGSCVAKEWLEAHPEFSLEEARRGQVGSDRAHPYPPWSGPAGQSCGTCAKLCRISYHNKVYFKCGVLRASWTHGPGTDIRKKDPACKAWEPRVEVVTLIRTLGRV
jgi:hypothetical protein